MNNRSPAIRSIAAVFGLLLVIAALHGRSIGYGLFMDDHAHFRQLREAGWSLSELTEACRLELVGGVIDLWFLPECTLRFFRPVAFGLMKLTYTLSGWDAAAMHVASLAWHLAVCVLLMVLLLRLGTGLLAAWTAAGLFAIHPGHVATVQWIACQTELMVTAFLMAATLAYGRFRGWRGLADASAIQHGPERASGSLARSGGTAWVLVAWVSFGLALGCRENAIVFPVVILALEPLMSKGARSRALLFFGGCGVLVAGYLVTRWLLLHGAALPPRPYVVPPNAPDFVPYVLDKLCYYLLGEFLLAPVVPIGGLAYLREHPELLYGGTAGVVAAVLLLIALAKTRSVLAFGIVWLIGFMLPALPAFESPHHLYLPGVGGAILVGAALAAALNRDGWRERGKVARRERPAAEAEFLPARTGRAFAASGSAAMARAAAAACLVTAGLFATATFFFGMALDTAQKVEDRLVDEVATLRESIRDGDTLYFANLPMIGHYVKLAVEHATGLKNLRVVGLTWAPRLLGVSTPAELVWLDAQTIEARIAGDRYFAGPAGLLVRQAHAGDPPIAAGDVVQHDGVRIESLETDAAGIQAIRFTFPGPVGRDGRHLFWGSMQRWAFRADPPRR